MSHLQYEVTCIALILMSQGTKEDYEKCITAAREAWNIWADVSSMITECC